TAVPAPDATPSTSTALDALTGGSTGAPPEHEQVLVDPRTLTLDANARTQLKITAEFKALVAEHGVRVPLLCRRDPLGNLLVIDGQRRLVTALELDLPLVPVAMLDGVGDDEARLWDQLVTNHGREALTASETAAAFHQLSLMGRSPETIAKRYGQRREVVERALSVAASKSAAKAAAQVPDATFDQLVGFAEFEGDKAATKVLHDTLAKEPARWDHRLQALRDERDCAATVAAAIADLPEGTTVLPEYPPSGRLEQLRDKVGGKLLTEKNHAACPGHAVHVQAFRTYNPNGWRAHLLWVCTQAREQGHVDRWADPSKPAPSSQDAKDERRRTLANNKAAVSAETVRRTFIHDLLQRKTLPADAPVYIARVLLDATAHDYRETALARTFVYGEKEISTADAIADLKTPHLATRALLAVAAARAELHTPKDFWRTPRDLHRTHLTALAAWGYGLSELEQAVVDGTKAGA
ncbi:MAG: ParB N-terminal domain-containing protein, partial [Cellulomonadaceae bacterium]|nr:ParB N-terminal domain-containing protein [Cellulomonadaceae bacterium]